MGGSNGIWASSDAAYESLNSGSHSAVCPTGIPKKKIHWIPPGEELVETGHADAKFRSFYQPCGSQAKLTDFGTCKLQRGGGGGVFFWILFIGFQSDRWLIMTAMSSWTCSVERCRSISIFFPGPFRVIWVSRQERSAAIHQVTLMENRWQWAIAWGRFVETLEAVTRWTQPHTL